MCWRSTVAHQGLLTSALAMRYVGVVPADHIVLIGSHRFLFSRCILSVSWCQLIPLCVCSVPVCFHAAFCACARSYMSVCAPTFTVLPAKWLASLFPLHFNDSSTFFVNSPSFTRDQCHSLVFLIFSLTSFSIKVLFHSSFFTCWLTRYTPTDPISQFLLLF